MPTFPTKDQEESKVITETTVPEEDAIINVLSEKLVGKGNILIVAYF